MKIRIKGNTVRFRLTKSDISTLMRTGELSDQTEFIGSTLIYKIASSANEAMSADMIGNVITLSVPENALSNWASTTKVSLEGNMLLKNNSSLYLLLEKDFKCMDGDVNVDQSDFFENPNITC
jgi:hypothetical protein